MRQDMWSHRRKKIRQLIGYTIGFTTRQDTDKEANRERKKHSRLKITQKRRGGIKENSIGQNFHMVPSNDC